MLNETGDQATGFHDDWQAGRLDIGFDYAPARGAGDIIGRTALTYWHNLPLILLLSAVLLFPLDLLEAAVDAVFPVPAFVSLGLALLQLVLVTIATGGLVFGLVIREREGRTVSLGEAVRWGGLQFGPLLIYLVVTGLLIVLGFVLLIAPGMFAWVALFLVVPIVAIEGRPRRDVLRRSNRLSEGRRWPILALLLVFLVMLFTIMAPTIAMEIIAEETGLVAIRWVVLPVSYMAFTLVGWFTTVGQVVVYLSAIAEQRGHCTTCGYSLAGNTTGTCPECGTPVPATADTAMPSDRAGA